MYSQSRKFPQQNWLHYDLTRPISPCKIGRAAPSWLKWMVEGSVSPL